jgi:peroxiredoxin Q/BCP
MSLQVGDRAPEIRADNFQLSKLRGKNVVVFFFPKANTSGCTKEACEFRDASPQFAKRNTEIIGISPEKAEPQQKWAAAYGLKFTLVPDPDHSIADAYGVWKEKSLYGRKYMGIERSTFLIDGKGKIAAIFPKVKVVGHAAKVLAAVENLTTTH